ncbi:hypothetical protein [uncultured Ruminococcus sp.]|uniref:hypothetical protein n=1 Tax=uncultured Ruminococcus sp. TaxID=165186 RepID=UPI0026221E59|nr:hypothetical protein [uncultured Ruminococcus sp.]
MDKLKYFRVMDLIDEDIIEEAEIKTAAPTETVSEKEITVSGTEKYRSISWHRLAAAASAVLLIAGVGAGGALMLRNRPPVLVESVDTTAEDTTENMEIKAGGSRENSSSEGTTDKATTAAVKTSEPKQKETKESNDISSPTEAENDGNDTEENTENPREENNEPEERENATTAAKTTQLPVLRTTVTKAQTPTNPPKVTTATKVLPPPEYFTTEPVTERPTPEHDPGYIPYLTWYPEDGAWLMNTLSGLAYSPWSYDVTVGGRPPEGYIRSGGNEYALCFSERWVRRNGCEQAYMPDEIYNYFKG